MYINNTKKYYLSIEMYYDNAIMFTDNTFNT
nr:MAG TPA: hypothetical protein [Caudoviricetes sp.]DAG28802.1 MAG TPA: hypothetical protein [Caudoviricetes sp.]DAM52433.1 MAG TPA: hypothetical protein [Caudoviricetes sp.]